MCGVRQLDLRAPSMVSSLSRVGRFFGLCMLTDLSRTTPHTTHSVLPPRYAAMSWTGALIKGIFFSSAGRAARPLARAPQALSLSRQG